MHPHRQERLTFLNQATTGSPTPSGPRTTLRHDGLSLRECDIRREQLREVHEERQLRPNLPAAKGEEGTGGKSAAS